MPIKSPFHAAHFVSGPLPTMITGNVIATLTENVLGELRVHLSAASASDDWSTTEEGILLTPTFTPIRYQFFLQLDSSAFSLLGAQVYRISLDDASTEAATIFIPVASEQVELNLLHDIQENGTTVIYQLFIGVTNNSTGAVSWPDPTIAFDPQAGGNWWRP
jgi:hypothetical protein